MLQSALAPQIFTDLQMYVLSAMPEPPNPPVVRVAESGCSDHPKEPDAPVVFHVGQIVVLEDVQLANG